MVCVCLAGGRLSQEKLREAARLHATGNGIGAANLCREVLKDTPQQPEALHLMAVIAQQGGNTELALKLFELTLAADPGFVSAWYNRALILHALTRNDQALISVQSALDLDPKLAEAWNLMGLIFKADRRYAQAQECHQLALILQPNNPLFHDNYALLLLAMDDYSAAYKEARHAEQCASAYASIALTTIVNCMGYPELALKNLAAARAYLPPALVIDSLVTEGMTLLQIGEFDQGWKLLEQRVLFPSLLDAFPLWDGNKIKHLFLYEDQGLGDALQFLRYIPLLKQRTERVTLCVREPLQKLCMENFPDINVILESDPALAATPDAARCRLMSLPVWFDLHLSNIPPAPYLGANKTRCTAWHDALRDLPPPHIGLVWAGGAGYKNDASRSLPFSVLEPVVEGFDAHFISLQKARSEDKSVKIFDAAPLLHDFADTAALIMELDLVITVDTAVAHLAGALGKPVWILLPFNSDWRWFLGREDSPWYKTARLFRQRKPGDWAGVIERVRHDCHAFIKGDRTVLQPEIWQGGTLRQNPYALSLPL